MDFLNYILQATGYSAAVSNTGRGKKRISLPIKIQGDSYSCDLSESEYDKQIALSPTNV